ncbi:unnamed protein product [Caenorhabditis bovis]|uniref:Uncharacterized protein n=1 Tax=Caenorhabditis bovis TaxID=2654633 RepID=A0A8S1EX57_9PELO|nr:unnamed protein product [Caenorhabditis bovis]
MNLPLFCTVFAFLFIASVYSEAIFQIDHVMVDAKIKRSPQSNKLIVNVPKTSTRMVLKFPKVTKFAVEGKSHLSVFKPPKTDPSDVVIFEAITAINKTVSLHVRNLETKQLVHVLVHPI